MKTDHTRKAVKRLGMMGHVFLFSVFLLGTGAQAEKWVTGIDSVVYNGVRYVADIDTLKFYDVVSGDKIDELKLFDRDEDYKNNPKKYEVSVPAQASPDAEEAEGEKREDEEKVEVMVTEPQYRWERIGNLMVRAKKMSVLTNMGNIYIIDLDSKKVVKKTPEDQEREEQAAAAEAEQAVMPQENIDQENQDKEEKF